MKPYYQDGAVTIYHGDCREILPALPRADLLLTDPPYGIGAHEMPEGHDRTPREVLSEWDAERPDREVFVMLLASADEQIIWGGNYFADLLPRGEKWLCWDKCQVFSGSDFELAWTSYVGAMRICRITRVEAYCHGTSVKGHPTVKPLRLFKWCIEVQSEGVAVVIDPFMGSGTTLRAAKDLNRKAVGIEIEEKYCEIAANRMSQEVLDFSESEDAS